MVDQRVQAAEAVVDLGVRAECNVPGEVVALAFERVHDEHEQIARVALGTCSVCRDGGPLHVGAYRW